MPEFGLDKNYVWDGMLNMWYEYRPAMNLYPDPQMYHIRVWRKIHLKESEYLGLQFKDRLIKNADPDLILVFVPNEYGTAYCCYHGLPDLKWYDPLIKPTTKYLIDLGLYDNPIQIADKGRPVPQEEAEKWFDFAHKFTYRYID